MKYIIFVFILLSKFVGAEYHNDAYKRPFYPYYSQAGQDKFLIEKIFGFSKKGVFFDIGAHDGVSYSNTYFFEKECGWTGVCVEAQPENYFHLKRNRKCICLKGGIFDREGEVEFLKVNGPSEMLSGILETYESKHLERAKNEIKELGGSLEIVKIKTFIFNQVCKKYGITHIDVLSIDTEGSEERIFKTIDFENIDIDVILVENNYQSNNIRKFLGGLGYKFLTTIGDDIYKKVRK